ncbi:MAG: rod-binding protein [Acidobacteriia bacterium]|nr:rod-binding protein [Terriglobia bacterium]
MIQAIAPRADRAAETGDSPKTRDAARQFEALLLAQILRSAHAGADEDSVNELADQQLALTLAERGGLGLADLIAKGLAGSGNTPTR